MMRGSRRCFLPPFLGITSGWGGKGSNTIWNLEDIEGRKFCFVLFCFVFLMNRQLLIVTIFLIL